MGKQYKKPEAKLPKQQRERYMVTDTMCPLCLSQGDHYQCRGKGCKQCNWTGRCKCNR